MEEGYIPGVPVAPELEIRDPETFARVWRRVMPDQALSPVEPMAVAERISAPQATGPDAPGQEGALARTLEELMALLRTGAWQCQALGRRAGRGGGGLSAMAREQAQALRRLAACHFLCTGEHYLPRTVRPAPYTGMVEGMRQQFLREGELVRLLARAAALSGGEVPLDALCSALSADAQARRGRLHTMVEQRYPMP